MSDEPTFDPRRQAELAGILERLDRRDALDRAEIFARAARTLPPPPAVARVLEADDGTGTGTGTDEGADTDTES